MTSLEELRTTLTEDQRKILNEIWKNQYETRKPTFAVALYEKFGRDVVESAFENLSGNLIWGTSPGRIQYMITPTGILLTEQGVKIEQLLMRYLQYVQKLCAANLELNQVRSEDVDSALALTPQESYALSQVLNVPKFGNLQAYSYERWIAGVPYPQDDFLYVRDFATYIESSLLADFDPMLPVDERKQSEYRRKDQESRSPAERNEKNTELNLDIFYQPQQQR